MSTEVQAKPDSMLTIREAFELHYYKGNLRDASLDPFRAAFRLWEQCTDNPPLCEITNRTLERFRDAAVEKGKSPRTINGYWTNLRSVLRRMGPPHDRNPWGLDVIPRVPAMRLLRVPFKRPRRVSMDELSRAYLSAGQMRHPRTGTPDPAAWWRALLVLAYYTGLRFADLLKAEWRDVNFEERTLYAKVGKTGVEADLPLHPAVIEHLFRLGCGTPRIFGFNDAYISSLWKSLRERAGVDFGFHDIRRTACSELNAVAPGMGKVLLLHAPTNVTERSYLNAIPELRDAIEKMNAPIAFRHGVKMVDRAVKSAFKQVIHPSEFLPPIHPPEGSFVFSAVGFYFKGQFFPMAAKRLAIIRVLCENGCAADQRVLWEATDDRPFPGREGCRTTLFQRIHNASTALRDALNMPKDFSPIVSTSWANGSRLATYELFLPPALLKDDQKGGDA